MKNKAWPLLAIILLIAGCQNRKEGTEQVPDSQFRSIIRLWGVHHQDSLVNSNLMEAIRKYPGSCNEVWFLFDPNIKDGDIEEDIAKMKSAAEKMRDLGVTVSLQDITIGHPSREYATDPLKNALGYRPVMGHHGEAAESQSCPRDKELQKRHAYVLGRYAEAIKPYAIYLDDDLRLTQHYPAGEICFCGECIREFNERTGGSWTRESLVKALDENVGNLRKEWVRFSQDGLAEYARCLSQAAHKASPETRMGLQHTNFHSNLLEGWDWNPIFRAMKEATGLDPVSRPGHGYYKDYAPREMIEKATGISRQINRLEPGITFIAPEIESYDHRATGKSYQSLLTETLYYLSMGATSMSYAIICANREPMEWYRETYLKNLDRYHNLYCEYVDFNRGTWTSGIDSYLSPDEISLRKGEDFSWAVSDAGSEIMSLVPLGVPYTPEGRLTTASTLDLSMLKAMSDEEADSLMNAKGLVMDRQTFSLLERRGLTAELRESQMGYITPSGKRLAVLESFNDFLTGKDRDALLRSYDWASEGRMSVIVESMDQAIVVPRSTPDGTLRSVTYINCTISDEQDVTLRLRGCPEGDLRITWKTASDLDHRLRYVKDGDDILLTLPFIKAWDGGWIAIEKA